MKCIYDDGRHDADMKEVGKNCKVCVATKSGVSCVNGCVIELLDRNTMFKQRMLSMIEEFEDKAKSTPGKQHYTMSPQWKFAQIVRKMIDNHLLVSDEQASIDRCNAILEAEKEDQEHRS